MSSAMSHSNTITSFYTLAERKRALKYQQKTNNTRNGYFVNRSIDTTPYICLPARFSQALFNKFTLVFAVLAVYMHVFGELALWGLDFAHRATLNECTAAAMKTDYAQVPHFVGQAMAGSAKQAIDNGNQQALDWANSTLSNAQNQALAYVDLVASAYEAVAKSGTSIGEEASKNATKTVSDWVNKKLDDARSKTQKDLDQLSDSLKKLEKSLDNSIFKGTKLDGKANISLSAFNLNIPNDLNMEYDIKTAPEFGKLSNQSKTSVKAMSALASTIDKFNVKDLKLPNNATNDRSCPLANEIGDTFKKMNDSVAQIQKNCVATSIVFGVLALIGYGLWEYYHWKKLLVQAKALETLGGFQDAVENMNRAQNPLVNWVADELVKYFACCERTKLAILWTTHYILSPVALTLAGVGCYLILAYIMQISIMTPVYHVDSSKLTAIGTVSNTTLGEWSDQANQVISNTEKTTNSQLQKYFDKANAQIKAALMDSAGAMQNEMADKLGSLNLPNITARYDKKLVYTPVKFPRITDQVSIPPSHLKVSASGPLDKLARSFGYFTLTHLQMGLGLFSAWLALALLTVIYSIIKIKFFKS